VNPVLPGGGRRGILVAVVEYGELPEMLRVADALGAGLAQPVVVFFAKRNYRRLDVDSAAVLARGHRWMDSEGRVQDQPAATTPPLATEPAPAVRREFERHPIVRRAPVIVAALLPLALAGRWTVECFRALATALRGGLSECRSVLRQSRRFRQRYDDMARVLREHDPELVVVGQDLLGHELSFLLLAAARASVPTMIVPFAMFSLREVGEYALTRPAHHVESSLLNRVLASLYPHWVLEQGSQRLLRLPGPSGLALERSRLIGGHPWVPCSEPADRIACDSEAARRNLIALGLPEASLRVVGAPVHDALARAIAKGADGRRALLARHRLGGDGERPLVACGWPANLFPWLGGRRIAYGDYAELSRAWARHLADVRQRYGVDVLLTVHPKTLDTEMAGAIEQGLAYQRGNTEEVVAHCDVFVTLNGSSITAWAIACGKPVLLFDCYDTGYTDFDQVPGCVLTTDEATFAGQLARLCSDADGRATLARAQAGVAAQWGVLDGRSADRLAALAVELLSGRRHARGQELRAPDASAAARDGAAS